MKGVLLVINKVLFFRSFLEGKRLHWIMSSQILRVKRRRKSTESLRDKLRSTRGSCWTWRRRAD